MSKAAEAFRTISEVADELEIPKHVLRFWEVKFPQIRPMKRGGGRRYYRPEDLELLKGIRHLLHAQAYTIKGVQKILREQGVEFVKQAWQSGAKAAPATPAPAPAKATRRTAGAAKATALPAAHCKLLERAIRELEACRTLLGAGEARAAAAPRRARRA